MAPWGNPRRRFCWCVNYPFAVGAGPTINTCIRRRCVAVSLPFVFCGLQKAVAVAALESDSIPPGLAEAFAGWHPELQDQVSRLVRAVAAEGRAHAPDDRPAPVVRDGGITAVRAWVQALTPRHRRAVVRLLTDTARQLAPPHPQA